MMKSWLLSWVVLAINVLCQWMNRVCVNMSEELLSRPGRLFFCPT